MMCFSASIGILTIVSGVKMWSLEMRRLAVWASVLAMIPCTLGALIGLPCGIWALVVMGRREVRAAFDADGG